jgi:hypothetical protein
LNNCVKLITPTRSEIVESPVGELWHEEVEGP